MAKVSKASSVFCSVKGLEIVVVREGLDRGSVKERRWTKSRLGVRGRMLCMVRYKVPSASRLLYWRLAVQLALLFWDELETSEGEAQLKEVWGWWSGLEAEEWGTAGQRETAGETKTGEAGSTLGRRGPWHPSHWLGHLVSLASHLNGSGS